MCSMTAVCAQGPEWIVKISGWGLGEEWGQQGLEGRNALNRGVGTQVGVGFAERFLTPCVFLFTASGPPPH